jgi:AraC family ethanolamine operon transcriptional activator
MEFQYFKIENRDPDVFATVVDGSHMQHRVLPGGSLAARVDKIQLDDGAIQRGHYDMGILVDGMWPAELITIGLVLYSPDAALVNGMRCPPCSVQMYGEGCELCYRAPPGTAWLAYCVERERIQQAAVTLYGRPLPIPKDRVVSFEPGPVAMQRIVSTIRALFDIGHGSSPHEIREKLARPLQEFLCFELARVVDQAQRPARNPSLRQLSRRRNLVRRAEEYLQNNLGEPFSLKAIAESAGTSARMLEYHFREVYGMTPGAWFRSMKMNAVYRELQELRGEDVRISDIAMSRGFFHLGRFSSEYRALFGESPSQTLKRS